MEIRQGLAIPGDHRYRQFRRDCLLPFARLKDAGAGTQILVTDVAATGHPYVVQSVSALEKADVDWVAAFNRAGRPRLTLVTCGGSSTTRTVATEQSRADRDPRRVSA